MRSLLLLSFLLFLASCGSKEEVAFQALDIRYEGDIAIYEHKGKPFTGKAIEANPSLVYHHYIENGLEVLEEAFYPSGEKERHFPMKNGFKDSTCTMWYKSGQLQLEETYFQGELHGTVKRYAPTGELLDEKQYEHGKFVLNQE